MKGFLYIFIILTAPIFIKTFLKKLLNFTIRIYLKFMQNRVAYSSRKNTVLICKQPDLTQKGDARSAAFFVRSIGPDRFFVRHLPKTIDAFNTKNSTSSAATITATAPKARKSDFLSGLSGTRARSSGKMRPAPAVIGL